MNYLHELQAPQKWKAGSVGSGKTRRDFYHDCADCHAKEPVIKGFLSTATEPRFEQMCVLRDGSCFRLAVFCPGCFDKRLAPVAANLK